MNAACRRMGILAGLTMMIGSLPAQAGGEPFYPDLDEVIPKAEQVWIRSSRRSRGKGVLARADASFGPARYVLLKGITPVRIQWGGTCSTFGLIGAAEVLFGGKQDISERHLWSTYQKYSAVSAVDAFRRHRIVHESDWPEKSQSPLRGYEKRGRYSIVDVEYLGDDVRALIKAIDGGYPGYIATTVTVGMRACHKFINPRSPATKGGHAMAVVGYKVDPAIEGGGYLVVKNSWGKSCGEGGLQLIPFHHCTAREDLYCALWSLKQVSDIGNGN